MSSRIRRKLLWTLFLLVLVVLAGVAASATTLVRMNFEELAQQATAITRARCLGSTSVWRNGEIWTETEFGVLEVSKGSAPGILRISLPGGSQVAFVMRSQRLLRHWIPALAGMTPLFPIAATLRVFLLDICVTCTSSVLWCPAHIRAGRPRC